MKQIVSNVKFVYIQGRDERSEGWGKIRSAEEREFKVGPGDTLALPRTYTIGQEVIDRYICLPPTLNGANAMVNEARKMSGLS